MSFKNLIKILFVFILVECLALSAIAAPAKVVPTRITSEVIDIKRNSQTMEFFGNVVVKKGADTMIADKMMVLYEEKDNAKVKEKEIIKEEKKEAKIKRIDAYDHVKITSAEFVATGNKGHYDPIQEFFVLEENVVVNNGKSIANGDKFVYNLKTKKGNFVGKPKEEMGNSDNRVVVTIGSEDMKSKKKPKKEENKND